MKTLAPVARLARDCRRPVGAALFLLGCLALHAQPVVPGASAQPPDTAPAAIAKPPEEAPSLAAPAWGAENRLVVWGPFSVRPRLGYGFQHGDGIHVQPGRPLTTSVSLYSAGLLLEAGRHWTIDYSGVRSEYTNPEFRDAWNDALQIIGGTVYGPWTVRVSHTYQSSLQPLVETATQAREHANDTSGYVACAINTGWLAEATVQQKLRTTAGFPSVRDWPATAWLTWRTAPNLDLGAGVTGGFAVVDPGANMAYVTPQARVRWLPDRTVFVELTAGEEDRTFYGGADTSIDHFVYSGMVEYRPFRTTALALYRVRDNSISYFASQIAQNTRIGVRLQQRLLGRFFLAGAIEQNTCHYVAVDRPGATPSSVRDDTFRIRSLQLSTVIRNRLQLSISYQRARNNSNNGRYAFASDQTGIELNLRY